MSIVRTMRKQASQLQAGDVIALPHLATDPYDVVLYTVTDKWEGCYITLAADYQRTSEPSHTTLQLDHDRMVTVLSRWN
jgi:hypothetical protein